MFITLTKIRSDREQNRWHGDDSDDPEERERNVVTQPVTINTARVRCFYPRKDNRVGTRLTFADGGGFAVTETYEQVQAMIAGEQRGFIS